MLSMWGDAVSAPLNAVHLGFGFGAVGANLLVMPFLVPRAMNTFSNATTSMSMTTTKLEVEVSRQSNLFPPHRISSLICLIIALGHLLIFVRQRSRDREVKREKKEIDYLPVKKGRSSVDSFAPYSPRSFGFGSLSYGLAMSFLWLVYMFFLGGNDQTFSKFFFAYLSSEEFHLTPTGATWGMIVYWLSYSVRLSSVSLDLLRNVSLDRSIVVCRSDDLLSSSLRFEWFVVVGCCSCFHLVDLCSIHWFEQ